MIRDKSDIPAELQRIQDEKGYIVLAVWLGNKKIGDTLNVVGTTYGDLECTTVVIGFSTFEEWRNQNATGFQESYKHIHTPGDYQYVKVIAE